jgi:argininosuccinate lyase
MALWGGRFSQGPAQSVAALSRSVEFDWRLAQYDIRVNIAHVRGLENAKVINPSDALKIIGALRELSTEIESHTFTYNESDEDVHSAIERGLVAKLGDLGGAFRAGRSRNDLVVTDFKLYLIDHILEIALTLTELIDSLNRVADDYKDALAPGFTHLQHAQPINFGHEIAKHSHAFLRDISRIEDWIRRNSTSPLGAGALAGSALQPHPEEAAEELGFSLSLGNSIDAVSDRDFVAEALFIFSVIGIHLSRIGEEFTLWSSTEFSWARLDDAFSTGSSIMPQKKNPDIAELARGKSGRLIGNLTGLLAVLKGLPFAYNRDLQEDKEPTFDSVETLQVILPAVIGMIQTTTFDREKLAARAVSGHALATEIADYLARKGVPFAQAHEASGACVKLADSLNCEVHELTDTQLASVHPEISSDIRSLLSGEGATASRTSMSGTSTQSIAEQVRALNQSSAAASQRIESARKSFSRMMSI